MRRWRAVSVVLAVALSGCDRPVDPAPAPPSGTQPVSPPNKVLLMGKRVYADFQRLNVGEPEPVQRRCDPIPDSTAFTIGPSGRTDTGYKCEFLSKRDEQTHVWLPLQVILDSNGVVSFVRLE
jgi:hypothetical protein